MEKKRKLIAAFLTLLLCCIIFIVLLFMFAFKTPLPLPEEEGVVIETNAGGGGGGSDEVFEKDFYESLSKDNAGETDDNLVSQEIEEVNFSAGEKKSNKEILEKKPTMDNRISSFNWGKGSGVGSGTGTGSGTGSGDGVGSGAGNGTGSGSGPGYSLKGRGAKSLPFPSYTEEDQGKVVVTIWVNKEGAVTRAEPGAIGTTVSNPTLWTAAKNAALKAKFSANDSAPEIQKGIITYTFIKGN